MAMLWPIYLALLAQGASAAAPPAANDSQISPAEAEARLAKCGQRQFESKIEFENAGKVRRATIKLCAKPTDSDADWIATLERASKQIEASPQLSAAAKTRVVGEIQAAIDKARAPAAAAASPAQPVLPTTEQTVILPITQPVLGRARVVAPPVSEPIVGLPPLIAPPAPAPVAATAHGRAVVQPVRVTQRLLPKPRITIFCPPPGEPSATLDCTDLARDTVIAIRADENLANKVSIGFVRDGDARGAVSLGTLRRGQVVRARLPQQVCAGVVRGRVELQTIVTDGRTQRRQVVDTAGPLNFRC